MRDSFASLGMTGKCKCLILFALILLTGCKEKVEMDLEMYNSEQVSLMVKGKKVYTYDEGTGQSAYNARSASSGRATTT